MLLLTLLLFQQATKPAFFGAIVVASLLAGGIGWLIASVLGFARAPAFGPAARWFSYAAVCLILYHLQFLLFGLLIFANASQGSDVSGALTFGAFFNLFVVLGSVCMIMGFVQLTKSR